MTNKIINGHHKDIAASPRHVVCRRPHYKNSLRLVGHWTESQNILIQIKLLIKLIPILYI